MKRKIQNNFFKNWSSEMAYVLGYITADGCVIKRKNRRDSYVLNITSKDKSHLKRIKDVLHSNYPISTKYNSQKMPYSQIQICNREICEDLMKLGIFPRKTSNLSPIKVPEKYFPDFVRGFFDGDGTVYIYKVNRVPQIKAGFTSTSLSFLAEFNKQLCQKLDLPIKSIHRFVDRIDRKKLVQFNTHFYINDCKKLAEFMYKNNPVLFLLRKRKIFEKWESTDRRHYIKQNYPSKIGRHLNQKVPA